MAFQSIYTGTQIETCIGTYQNANQVQTAIDTAIDTATETTIATAIENAITVAKLAMYPVGSIYMSSSNVNPGTFIGGTWIQIQDTFLLAAGTTYTAGDTGGEAEHTLTVAEMPSHTHSMKYSYWVNANVGIKSYNYPGGSGYYYGDTSAAPNNTGSGSAHNNMPPYLVVYVWQRTA